MKRLFLLAFIFSAICAVSITPVKGQSAVNALVNAVETLEFLRDIKDNKIKLEGYAKEVKGRFKETDSVYTDLSDKYSIVKLAADNILNNLIIDLMDKDKRVLFTERPSIINDYYAENVRLYNKSVDDFQDAYHRTRANEDAGIMSFLKELANLVFGDLLKTTKRIAIEILVEKLKAPYSMKLWRLI